MEEATRVGKSAAWNGTRVKTTGMAVLLTACVLMAAALPARAQNAPAAQGPEQLARSFLKLFEQKDFDTIAGMFAPGALVQRARLGFEGPEYAHFDAVTWVDDSRQGIAGVEDFKMKVLEVTSLSFGEGVTVSVKFQATGRLGQNASFVNNGVDSFSFVQVEGEWKIVLYNSMEKLEFTEG